MTVLDNFRLDEQVIIVTGGAGLLGREYSRSIAEAGGIPVVVDIDSAASEVAKKITKETGGKTFALTVDVTKKSSVNAMIRKIVKRFGRIDGLINNAALNPKFEGNAKKHNYSFENFPLDLWDRSLDVDLTGMFLCAQAVAPVMLEAGSGSIINISSTYGLVGPDQRLYEKDKKTSVSFKPVAYSVTKSGVLGLTHYLAAYWAGKGIRVNSFTPHGVMNGHDKDFVKRFNYRSPLGRMADRSEYNGAIVFLLSSASSYMTGSNLVIDGGWTIW